MATKIRLARRGRKKMAMYDIVVADSKAPRDGRFIEKLGTYNPNTDPATINLNIDKAFEWVMTGAQPTDTAKSILSKKGVLLKKHLQMGVNKGAIKQEEADSKYNAWIEGKAASDAKFAEELKKKADAEAQARFEAEKKVREEMEKKEAEALAAAQAEADAANVASTDESSEEENVEAAEESAE